MTSSQKPVFDADVIVAGGGPAGLSAALMLGRSRRRTMVLDDGLPRNRFADHLHGVLGHDGRTPEELAALGRGELARYDVAIRDGRITEVTETDGGLEIALQSGERLTARALVAATGISDDLPPIPGLAERWGTSVLHCPYCHGWEVRERRLGVLLTSPLGWHQAQLVPQWSEDITVFTADGGEIDPPVERRLRARGVRLVAEPVVAVLGDGGAMSGVRLADGSEVPLDALFAAGTPRPHDGFLAALDLARTQTPFGAFVTIDATGRTSNPRVWAVGNLAAPMATIPAAMSGGAMAGAFINAVLAEEDADAAAAAMVASV